MGFAPSAITTASEFAGAGTSQDQLIKLGLADPNKFVDTPVPIRSGSKPMFNLASNKVYFRTNHRYSTDELAENLARMKIYHPLEFDQRMSFIDSEIKRRYVPARTTRNSIGKPRHHEAQDNGKFIRDAYNNAFKSRVYLDAMRNYELRQQQPDRYIPAGFESLQNLDVFVERGRMLQRRNIIGRRREQSQE